MEPAKSNNPFAFNLSLTEADRAASRERVAAHEVEAARLNLEAIKDMKSVEAMRLERLRFEAAETPTIGQAALRAAAITAAVTGTFVVASLIANVVLPPKE